MNAEEMQKVFLGQQQNALGLAPKPVAYEEWRKLLPPGTTIRRQIGQGMIEYIRIEDWFYEFTTGRPVIRYSTEGLFGRKFRLMDIDNLAYRLLLTEPPPWSKSSL